MFARVGVPILVVFVYLNLSQALVRRYDFPSLLQPLVVVLAFAAWLKHETDRVSDIARQRLTLLLVTYLLLAFASTAWAADRELADERLLDLAKATAIFLLATLLISNERRLRQAMVAVVASAFLLGALVFVQLATGRFDHPFFGLARIKHAQIYGEVFQPRIAGPLGDPNFFAQILLLALPVALLMGQSTRDRARKLAWWIAGAVILATILLTYSRGAMIALAVMGLMLVHALHVRWRTTLAAVALALVVFLLLPPSITRRLVTIEQILPSAEAPLRLDSSFQERRLLMQVAWVMFGANPVTGVGVGNYSARYEDYVGLASSSARQYDSASDRYYSHNLFLEVAAETGVLGLIVFGAVLIAAWRTLRAAKEDPIAQALQIGLVGFLIASLFLHLAFPRYLYLWLAFVLGVRQRSCRFESGGIAAALQTVRAPIAVLVSRFPLITETFILREIIELERQGQGVVLVPMIRESPAVVHEEAKPWIARAVYTPWLSPGILAANLRAVVTKPVTYLSLLLWVLPTLKSLALFPKSVYLAECLRRMEVGHLHAHFATHPATMARIISRLTGIPFSFTVHAHDIFVDRRLLGEKIRDAAFIRSISRFNRVFLEDRYADARGKIEVVHMGVPLP
jgi:putative inorganic carbon (hco3(-)) transporter